MKGPVPNIEDSASLLLKFNNREEHSFGLMYKDMFKEFHYYANSLYHNTTTDASDVVHDVFLYIWENRRVKFDTVKNLKSYIYMSIKSRYISYYRHLNTEGKVFKDITTNDDYFIFKAAEAEIFSLIPATLKLLPEECARSFQLFLEGWSVKEISESLNKPVTTIYSQREKAISILRKKISKDKLLLILLILK